MRGAVLPGNRTVELRDFARPAPGPGQVLLAMRASTICGSDIRAIYREHLGVGAEAYQGVIAGHEPAGEVIEVGDGVRRLQVGDRVAVYHIAGCGVCDECRHGYMIGCHQQARAAYGWQRDGGHAELMLAEEVTCLRLPDELTFLDGACVACGFGTAYEALLRAAVSGNDQLLITGLGPVGLAVGMLGRALGARNIVGTDVSSERIELARRLQVVDTAMAAQEADEPAMRGLSGGGFEVAIDCSGSASGRLLALQSMRDWGRCVFVGEGGRVEFDVSPLLIHRQLTLHGSWVTSLRHMEELLERLVDWQLHPEVIVTHRFRLEQAGEAYQLADAGTAGKVAILFEHRMADDR